MNLMLTQTTNGRADLNRPVIADYPAQSWEVFTKRFSVLSKGVSAFERHNWGGPVLEGFGGRTGRVLSFDDLGLRRPNRRAQRPPRTNFIFPSQG